MREINHLSVHQWLLSAIHDSQQPTSPIGLLFLKLPPPPCAVLLVLVSGFTRENIASANPWCPGRSPGGSPGCCPTDQRGEGFLRAQPIYSAQWRKDGKQSDSFASFCGTELFKFTMFYIVLPISQTHRK